MRSSELKQIQKSAAQLTLMTSAIHSLSQTSSAQLSPAQSSQAQNLDWAFLFLLLKGKTA